LGRYRRKKIEPIREGIRAKICREIFCMGGVKPWAERRMRMKNGAKAVFDVLEDAAMVVSVRGLKDPGDDLHWRR